MSAAGHGTSPATAAGDPNALKASLRRTARRALTALMAIEVVAIALLVVAAPWNHINGSGSRLSLVPVGVVILAPLLFVKMYRAARNCGKVVEGPVSTLTLTTEVLNKWYGRRYIAHLRRTPPDEPPVADLWVVYDKPGRYLELSDVEATVYGSLEPGTPAIAVTAQGSFFGRFRR